MYGHPYGTSARPCRALAWSEECPSRWAKASRCPLSRAASLDATPRFRQWGDSTWFDSRRPVNGHRPFGLPPGRSLTLHGRQAGRGKTDHIPDWQSVASRAVIFENIAPRGPSDGIIEPPANYPRRRIIDLRGKQRPRTRKFVSRIEWRSVSMSRSHCRLAILDRGLSQGSQRIAVNVDAFPQFPLFCLDDEDAYRPPKGASTIDRRSTHFKGGDICRNFKAWAYYVRHQTATRRIVAV